MSRSFYAILISQTTTNLAFALYTMAVVMHLYNETGSTFISAAVTFVSILARMLSGVYLPIISDRLKLTSLLTFSQFVQFILLVALIPLLSQSSTMIGLGGIFISLAFVSFFNGWFNPIKSSVIRAVVSGENRVKANSLLAMVDQTFLFAGWTLGGLLLSITNVTWTLFSTLVLMIISIISLFSIRTLNIPQIVSQDRLIHRLTLGWKYLFQHKGLRVLIMMEFFEAFVGTIWIGAVTLTYVQDALGKGEAWWGYINGGYYLGTIIGGFLVFRLSRFMKGRLSLFMISGSFTFGLLTLMYGFTSVPAFALFLVILMGPSYQIRDLAQETMFQNSADEQKLTKIFAAKSTLVQFIFLFSIIGIGLLTDLIGVRLIYILSGSLLIISAVFGFIHLYILKKGVVLEEEHSITI